MKLRRSIKFYEFDDNTFHMHDELNDKHFNIGREQKEWLELFDGEKTFEEIKHKIPSEYIEQFMNYVDRFDLLESNEIKKVKINKFKIKFKIANINSFLEKIKGICKIYSFILDKTFYIFLLMNIYLIYMNINNVFLNTTNAFADSAGGLIFFCSYLLLLITGFLHEFSHAFVAKSKGVAIPLIGIMLFYFNPAFYVDLSGISMLNDRDDKIKVLSAGIKINNFLLFLSLFCIEKLNFSFMTQILSIYIFLNSITILINIIPFVEFDGYFIYSEILNDRNLKLTTSIQLNNLLKKKFYKVQVHYILYLIYSLFFSSAFLILGLTSIVRLINLVFEIPVYIVIFLIVVMTILNIHYQIKKVVK